MAQSQTKMIIEINEPILSKVIAVRGDANSRFIDVQLYNEGVPVDLTSHTVTMSVKTNPKSPMKNPVDEFISGTIPDPTNGRCMFPLTTSMLAEAGALDANIAVFSGEQEVLSTLMFTIYVEPSTRSDEQIEAENEFGALVVLFSEIQNALDDLHAIATSFGEPGEKAQSISADTFWKMLEYLYTMNEESLGNIDVSEVQRVVDEINGKIGTNADFSSQDTLFGFSKNASLKSDETTKLSDVFDLVRLKTEVIKVKNPDSTSTKEVEFVFSSGKKKIKYITYDGRISSGKDAAYLSGSTIVFVVDGTQYSFVKPKTDDNFGCINYSSHTTGEDKSVLLQETLETSLNPISVNVENTFSIKATLTGVRGVSANVKMIIYYE